MAKVLIAMFLLFVASTGSAQETRPSKAEEIFYHSAQAALISSWVLDEWTTVESINNPIHVSYMRCEDGSQTCQSPVSWESTVAFRETGWASWYGIQRPASVVIAATVLDAGVFEASRRLYKKGGIWRKIAIGLLIWKAGDHLAAGMGGVNRRKSVKSSLVPAGAFSVSW